MLSDPLGDTCKKLGIARESLAGVEVLLLPENIESASTDLYDSNDAIAFAKYLKSSGLSCKTAFDLGARPKVLDRRGADVWLGVLWILATDANTILVATVSKLLADWIKQSYLNTSQKDSAKIHLKVIKQDGDKMSSLDYTGSADDFLAILDGLKRNYGRD